MTQEEPAKEQFALLEIIYGLDRLTQQPLTVRITNANQDLVTSHGEFFAAPAMSVDPIIYEGTLDDRQVLLKFSKTIYTTPLVELLTSPFSTPGFRARLWEYYTDDNSSSLLIDGDVSRVIENKDGQEGVVELSILNEKLKLDKLAGAVALDECDNTFASPACGVTLLVGQATVTDVTKFVITVTNPFPDVSLLGKIWDKGYMDFNGNRVIIRHWDPTIPDTFHVREMVAQDWVGQIVLLGSGCDQKHSTCVLVHNNEEFFNGIGSGVVDYNPLFENPEQNVPI